VVRSAAGDAQPQLKARGTRSVYMSTRAGMVASALVGAVVFAGCMAQTPHERASAQGVSATTLARSLNDAGFAIFKASGDDANFSVSPVSIGIAFGLVKTGASGSVDAALDDLFNYPAKDAELLREFNALDLSASSEAGEGAPNIDGTTVPLPVVRIANRAYIDEGFEPRADYLVKIGTYFGSDAVAAPLSTDPERSREMIDGWVSEQTEGLVKHIVPEGQPREATRLMLVNAVYMKAQWLSPFDASFTSDGRFRLANGEKRTVPFMRQSGTFEYVERPTYQAVSMPYVGDLEMVLVVPSRGSFDSVQASLSQGFLDDLDAGSEEGYVAIGVPRFEAESTVDLREAIESNLGVEELFGEVGLDGIASDLEVDSATHATHVIVDEAGTEAGAATVIGIALTSMPMYDAEVIADRPFLYVIRDTTTGAVLFVGRYTDPLA
jgi:serpin B